MSDTRIKICGITNLADARYAAGAGADYLGFIQHPESPRYIEPGLAKDIIEWIYGPQNVGVFVDRSPAEVNAAASLASFDLVQLHGNESPEDCAACEKPVIKAIHVGGTGSAGASTPEDIAELAGQYAGSVQYLLLDTAAGAISGGTGRTFPWSLIPDLPVPYFLAGGLTPGNVGAAVSMSQAFAVDTSSGVEEAPGRKDFELIDAFVTAVRST